MKHEYARTEKNKHAMMGYFMSLGVKYSEFEIASDPIVWDDVTGDLTYDVFTLTGPKGSKRVDNDEFTAALRTTYVLRGVSRPPWVELTP